MHFCVHALYACLCAFYVCIVCKCICVCICTGVCTHVSIHSVHAHIPMSVCVQVSAHVPRKCVEWVFLPSTRSHLCFSHCVLPRRWTLFLAPTTFSILMVPEHCISLGAQSVNTRSTHTRHSFTCSLTPWSRLPPAACRRLSPAPWPCMKAPPLAPAALPGCLSLRTWPHSPRFLCCKHLSHPWHFLSLSPLHQCYAPCRASSMRLQSQG